MSAKSAKKSAKSAAKSAKKSVLSHAQRSAIARLAALKAHLHKSFQSDRTPAERTQAKQNFAKALRSAPAFVRERVTA